VDSTVSVVSRPKSSIRFFRAVLLCAQIVAAQQIAPTLSSRTLVQFRIPAQPMGRALREFAFQARLQLIFATDDIASGTLAPAISGTYLPEAALAQLLANTCLSYKFINTNTVSIEASRITCH
jgi:hypothetical protein